VKHHLVTLSLAFIIANPLSAQGPLTPPGAPEPTMKTLTQIEPRIDVLTLGSAPPYVINQPGSYYLSANITTTSNQTAIEILAENVTLDLNGFTIFAMSGGSMGTAIAASQAAVIRNGFIKSGGLTTDGSYAVNGFLNGVRMSGKGTVTNLIVEGCEQGINTIGTVTDCHVSQSSTGITADTVVKCISENCAHIGIFVSTRCSHSVGSGHTNGIFSFGAEIDQCHGIAVYRTGIRGNNVTRSNGTGGVAGIIARGNVTESTGTSTRVLYVPGEKQYGIQCKNAISSTGIAEGNAYSTGIDATDNVSDSTGTCTSALDLDSIGLVGISCSNASNCRGIGTNRGIRAFGNASNCYGKAGSYLDGTGIRVDGTASFCRGDHSSRFGIALEADIAIGCTRAQGSINASSKQLGTP
jgi:hypothetical protein